MRIALACLLVGCLPTAAQDNDADSPAADGAYQMRSQIDLTVEALLPDPAEEAIVTLRDFSTNPAHTLIDVADQAGVPAVQEIREALPDFLVAQLEGWINGEIAKLEIAGVPVTELAGDVAGVAQTALTHFALDSVLVIDGTTAMHALETLDLTPAGLDVRYSLAPLPAEVVVATTTCSSQGGKLAIGDHRYGLPYGEYMWAALNQGMTTKYGYDIRGALGAAVNCPALGQTIAAKCLSGYCVGHATQLTEICERGLDEVVDQVHARFAETRFDALHFAAGTATLVDGNADGTADRLDRGAWTAEINAGLGLRPVPATFTATR